MGGAIAGDALSAGRWGSMNSGPFGRGALDAHLRSGWLREVFGLGFSAQRAPGHKDVPEFNTWHE